MSAPEIAARLGAKRCSSGKWLARCPAHADRRPSLSIAEGSERRVLLRCFAGCTIETIVSALGITLRDLFDGSRPCGTFSPAREPSAAELRVALTIEERRYRQQRNIEGLLRTSEVNAIRATIAKRYDIELSEAVRPTWEGAYGGRERDPAWPAIFDWAITVASVRLLGAPIAFAETLLPPRAVLVKAEELAAAAMRSLERDARSTQCEAAA